MFDDEKIFSDEEIEKIKEKKKKILRSDRRLYSQRRERQAKTCKYTLKFYDNEYELIRDQAKQLNITLQKLFDFLIIDGFLNKDPRIIEFINDCIKIGLEKFDRKQSEIDRFSILDLNTIIKKIERE